jgi:hypothetical protein
MPAREGFQGPPEARESAALRAIVEGASYLTREDFFQSLAQHLALSEVDGLSEVGQGRIKDVFQLA